MTTGVARRTPLENAATMASFLVTVAVQVVGIPVLLAALGTSGFAVFQILTGLAVWAVLVPLGFDRALKTELARGAADGEPLVRATRSLVLVLLVAGATLAVACASLLAPPLLGGLAPGLAAVVPLVAFLAMLVHGVGCLGRETLIARGRADTVAWLQIAAMTCVLAGMFALVAVPESERLLAALVLWLVPNAAAGVVALFLARLVGAPAGDGLRPLAPLLRPAGRFLVFLLASVGLSGIDFVVLSQIASADEVVLYTIASRVSAAVLLLATGLLSIDWARWAAAIGAGHGAQLQRQVGRQAVRWGCAALLLGLVLAPVFVPLCRLWLGDPGFDAPWWIAPAMGLALAMRLALECYGTALLAAGRAGAVTLLLALQTPLAILAQVLLFPSLGAGAMFIGFAVVTAATSAWMLPSILRSTLREVRA